jgi:hypothetical protein
VNLRHRSLDFRVSVLRFEKYPGRVNYQRRLPQRSCGLHPHPRGQETIQRGSLRLAANEVIFTSTVSTPEQEGIGKVFDGYSFEP